MMDLFAGTDIDELNDRLRRLKLVETDHIADRFILELQIAEIERKIKNYQTTTP